jgi:hypothetical protein
VYELTGLTGARSRLEIALARGLTPFAGRELEMAALAHAVGHARAGRGQVVGIVGEPGVGKSRLMWELLRSDHLRGWVVLRAGAAAYGKHSLYLPVIELLRAALGIAPGDDAAAARARLAEALTADEAARFLSPVLALLDLPVDDARWASLDAGPAAAAHARCREVSRDPPVRARRPSASRSRTRTGSTTRRRLCSTPSWRAHRCRACSSS